MADRRVHSTTLLREAVVGQIRADLESRGAVIGWNDLLIAATVKSLDGILVTNNVREFSRVNGLAIEDWTIKH